VGDIIRFVPKSPTDLKVEDQIIESIESDTELILRDPGIKDFNKDDLYGFKILPKVDQTHVFKNVI
jgi:glycerol-3-phosphate O-acyltransferase/dihydroxyacetone phosphate acyltransferase